MKLFSFITALILSIFSANIFAQQNNVTKAPQPTACIVGTFSNSGSAHWKNITLVLQNKCGKTVDVRNTTITFKNADNLNTNFWGEFGSVSYPDNASLQITSQPVTTGGYLATLSFHIPDANWANSKLINDGIIKLLYGAPTAGYNAFSLNVYLLDNPPSQTANINLINTSAKPANVIQNFAVVNIMANGTTIQSVQLPWSSTQQISGLNPGTYNIQTNNVIGTEGSIYQGTANPATLTLAAGQTLSSNVGYTVTSPLGKINLQVPALPNELTGYTGTPIVTLTKTSNGSTSTKSINWNAVTTVDKLTEATNYHLATQDIVFNNYRCSGIFTPADLVSSTSTPPTASLAYTCVKINLANISLNVKGLTSSTPSINLTFTPNDGSPSTTKSVTLNNGSGSDAITLTQNIIYNVSATNVSGFSTTFQPQPLLATNNLTETVTYTAVTTQPGRVIGYIPGWKQPPSATDLANAGYTHAMIAFGVFSTTAPGTIVPAFDTVTKAYIDTLHNAGIKVLLSLGGASTSLPNTTVEFHKALQSASSPAAFQQAFILSIKNLITQYGFDGIDIDIESGLGVGGTMQSPTGDVAVLANILNQIHADLPNLLITLTPQTANISATSGFDGTWANYSALIMQTHDALSWVGIQLYNTGCMFGIDHVCYDPNQINSPNFSVAMATDVLTSWPQTDDTGRPTGFKPYISYLTANQIVLGYPAPNAQGGSDGAPALPNTTIKKAIQCLKSGVASPNSCGTYVPPKAYGLIGGVFNWEVTYDQNNQFKFARDLKACVSTGACD